MNRLFVKMEHNILPQIKDRFPLIYLERGRLEVDDSSVKWISSEAEVVRIPIATIASILLGPGTTVTHEAIKVLAQANTTVCWVGEDSFLFYAVGESPTYDTVNFRRQVSLATNAKTRTIIARKMFSKRFNDVDVSDQSIDALKGMEGRRIRALYHELAEKYHVGWSGRSYIPGNFELSDTTNKILTWCNSCLYGVISSVTYSLGYSPHVGFIHSGSPLPFVYDIADLYKAEISIPIAFEYTYRLAGKFDRITVLNAFREKIIDFGLLEKVVKDIGELIK